MVSGHCRYTIGKVIGAGSFGVVREAVHKKTNVHYACKTIPKLPKKGRGTPRYLLKIQTEVDAMLQLGPSLDAVFLQAFLLTSPHMRGHLDMGSEGEGGQGHMRGQLYMGPGRGEGGGT